MFPVNHKAAHYQPKELVISFWFAWMAFHPGSEVYVAPE